MFFFLYLQAYVLMFLLFFTRNNGIYTLSKVELNIHQVHFTNMYWSFSTYICLLCDRIHMKAINGFSLLACDISCLFIFVPHLKPLKLGKNQLWHMLTFRCVKNHRFITMDFYEKNFSVFCDPQQSWFFIGFEEVEIFVYSLKWKVFVLQKCVSICIATCLYFKSVYPLVLEICTSKVCFHLCIHW